MRIKLKPSCSVDGSVYIFKTYVTCMKIYTLNEKSKNTLKSLKRVCLIPKKSLFCPYKESVLPLKRVCFIPKKGLFYP